MATADQIKALIRSHVDRDDERFLSIALQVAAKEAQKGHSRLAEDIKNFITDSQKKANTSSLGQKTTSIIQPHRNELRGLLELSTTPVHKRELVLSAEIQDRLDQVISEQRQKDKLNEYGLSPRRKLLFTGPPGTGKTMTSAMLATELRLPIYTIVLDNLITRFMGETAAKLRLIFDHIKQTRAVYLFDEFDSIGAQRANQNDVGEIRRVLNSFLLFVEQDNSESIIVAATNHPEILDKALFRRFDDIIRFKKPAESEIKKLIQNRLISFPINNLDWPQISKIADGLSSAEVTRASEDAAKHAVLKHNAEIESNILIKALERRKSHSN